MRQDSSPAVVRLGIAAMLVAAVAAHQPALATHVGEDLLADQQTVSVTNDLIGAMRQFERTPAANRDAALQRVLAAAGKRRDALTALAERNPDLAAMRLLPPGVRARMPAAVQPGLERDAVVSGTVQASVMDDFAQGHAHHRFELVDPSGRRYTLGLARMTITRALALAGKRVQMPATVLDKLVLVTDPKQVQVLSADGTAAPATATATTAQAAVQGNQKTLVILTSFNDKSVECTAQDLNDRLFGTGAASMNTGYQQSSAGLVSFSGQVVGPITLPYSSTGSCDYNGWAAAANAAAKAAGFDPASYMRVSYAMPRNSNCGWSGLGALGGPLPSPTWVQACTATGVFSHELGHNLKFHHAATPTAEYGDGSDPMGGAKLVQSNAPNRVMAGWLAPESVLDVAAGGSYTLTALESAAATTPKVLRLPKADTSEYYYVSLRQPVGVDANLGAGYQNALSVHRSTGKMPAYTYLLATLGAGQTWTDATNGIQVTHQGVSGAAATVAVGMGTPTCARSAPTLSVAPASQSSGPGGTLVYAVSVTNNNSTACASTSFNLTQTLPPGFTGSWTTSTVNLAPGSSTSVNWTIASGTSVADAVYTLSATASEAAVSNSSQVHASYTVVSPVPPPPADATPPVVAITSPANGAQLSGRQVALSAAAADNVSVSSVEFYVDGRLLTTDTSAPYGASWNTRKASRGSHSIRVRAIDSSGNAAEQTISVTLN